jgi:hypothetical protein
MFSIPFICGAGTEIHFLEKLKTLELVIYQQLSTISGPINKSWIATTT